MLINNLAFFNNNRAGVGPQYLNFLDAYLAPRRARVVVEGASSMEFSIENTVFQGTVLGPPLWNIFFADAIMPASSTDGQPSQFADDLMVFTEFDKAMDNEELKEDMQICRTNVHA